MRASRRSCASACSSARLLALLLIAAGCSRPAPAGDGRQTGGSADREQADDLAAAAAAVVAASGPAAASTASAAAAGADAAPGAADALLAGEPVKAKSIGHTSYVLKLTLSNGAKAVFKARSRLPLGDRRYLGEIAAYRLAVALGLDNVPRAVPRAYEAALLRSADDFVQKALVDTDGRVRGALMPWIEQYRVLPLEEDAWRAKWEPWLTDPRATIPGDRRTLAREISTLVAFDYVTANWDRWSGANVAQDGATGELLYVDNDGAFYESPPPQALARQLALLRRVVRFSSTFVTALRALDAPKLRHVLGDESPGVPLLPDAVVRAADARRRTVLDVVDARVAEAGERATFAFE
jgi:hypothetical protein